jgi:large-conductance mechanosensitive channel
MKLTIVDIAVASLIVLKFTGVIDWTWAQTLSPLIILVVIGFIQGAIETFEERRNEK